MKKKKRTAFDPCIFLDDDGKPRHPDIDCIGDCDKCAWNPETQKRRLATGTFKIEEKTHQLHGGENFMEIVSSITNDCRVLYFKEARA